MLRKILHGLGEPRSIRRRFVLLILAINLCLVIATVWGHLWNNSLIEKEVLHGHLEELYEDIYKLENISTGILINFLQAREQSIELQAIDTQIREQESSPEIEAIRKALIEGERSGFSDSSVDEIRWII